MSGPGARRAALAARVAALTGAQRRALARAVGETSASLSGAPGESPGDAAGERAGAPQADGSGAGGGVGGADAGRLVACITVKGALPTARELDAFLRERLPEYMIPARYVVLDRLPRTAAGKLDREALDPERGTDLPADGSPAPIGPRDATEARLVEIWREVLGVDGIGVHDDFFELGGDSLLSIRAISRAGRAGIRITPEAFFDGPTIARLAAAASTPAPEVEQGPVVGSAPTTPIQEWFFERITEGRDRWNQAVLLVAPAAADRDAVSRALAELVAHHDALRLRFVAGDDGRRQEIGPPPASPPLRVVDLSTVPESARGAAIEAEADAEHASLRLEEGRLFRAILLDGGPGFRRILLVAHHLLVDAASWGVLLEDLSTLLSQDASGAPLRLPPKTTSVLAWAEGLVDLAAGPALDGAAARWTDRPPPAPWIEVPRDGEADPDGDRMEGAVTRSLRLDAAATAALLEEATRRLEATPQELLVAALLLAWRRWTGSRGLQLDVEGHGRDALGDRVDVSRTVGWFTTVFPVALEPAADGPAAAVATVAEAFARLPLRGAAHGLLRHLHPDPAVRRRLGALPRSGLLFNYLGTVDALLPPDSPLERVPGPTGRERSTRAPRAYPVEINARVERRRLTVDVEHGRALRPDSAARLAEALRTAIDDVSKASPGATSRFELAGLDDEGLGRVADLLAEIDAD